MLGQLPEITGSVLSSDRLAVVQEFLSAASGFAGGAPDPAALADFVADGVLGVPLESLLGQTTTGEFENFGLKLSA